MKCPTHNVKLVGRTTRYGIRFQCPTDGCTVACWDGQTSRPADDETRALRHQAHEVFDPIWKSKRMKRSAAYDAISELLGLSRRKTHIGMFDAEQCRKVIAWAEKQAVAEMPGV